MRFLKIILISYASIILLGLSYALLEDSSIGEANMPLYAKILIAFMYILAILNILYHVKSFRFYRREEKWNLTKKLPMFLWIATLCFSTFLLFLVGVAMYNNADKYLSHRYSSEDIFFISLLIGPSLLGFLEVSMLKKRIKMIRTKKDEIEEIGK
ncbi:hypothetical protein [Kordia sp.]|uniref:hypothetical protein n=1 Tax=Kordia sp. TaxID=1965332 RepID=UPI003B5A81A3